MHWTDDAPQFTAVPATHVPVLHASLCVQPLPSASQTVPSGLAAPLQTNVCALVLTQLPVAQALVSVLQSTAGPGTQAPNALQASPLVQPFWSELHTVPTKAGTAWHVFCELPSDWHVPT